MLLQTKLLRSVLLAVLAVLGLLSVAGGKDTKPAKPAKAELKVISVADAFAKSQDYSGKLGVKGTVAEVDTKARSFVILTPNPPGSCTSECCAPKRLPVEVKNLKGDLPKVDEVLVVVGDFKPLTMGFDFVPKEVRRGDKVILAAQKKS
jgi:hypothetical protein